MKKFLHIIAWVLMYPLSVILSGREYLYISQSSISNRWPLNSDFMWFVWTVTQFIILGMFLSKTLFRKTAAEIRAEQVAKERRNKALKVTLHKAEESIKKGMYAAQREMISIEPVPLSVEVSQKISKFGGIPYWPSAEKYPTSKSGKPLRFLAQFNLKEIPKNNLLPNKGLLQFFVSDEDYSFGIDGDFKVVYHTSISDETQERPVLESQKDFPIRGAFSLEFGLPEVRYPNVGTRIFDKIAGKKLSDAYILEENEVVKDYFDEQYAVDDSKEESQLGGYHTIIQDDRAPDGYILLFQMFSDYGSHLPKSHEIMWGDGGAAYFFIHPEDLKKLDFSKVVYTWDCY